jgi:3-methyladenine DNA glycosylase AlkD
MREKILEDLRSFSEVKFAQWLKPFLRITEESEEVVLGVRVPTLRKLAKKYKDIDLKILKGLLHSNIHESRALAVFIMILKSKKEPKAMCDLYLNNLNYINNWDLIDYSAPYIVAPNVEKEILRRLAESDYLWANRVAMVSTIYYIKQGNFDLTLELAEKFINHKHHLMHKATGWMLREVGKKDVVVLKRFLERFFEKMPSVMRSYATERLKKD